MQLRKYRWSKVYESAEEELIALLKRQNQAAERWTADGGETFTAHKHPYNKRLWCADGGILIHTQQGDWSLQAGDALDLPAGMEHSAVAGLAGCVCYEVHDPS